MRLAKLNRTMSHRNAMFRNMVSALIEHEQIKTTFPKAKAISRLAERVITWSKNGSQNLFYQRKAESYLMNWVRVRQHLSETLVKRYENRAGGYTRIHRIGFRAGDHAPLAIIELVDNARDLKRDKVVRTVSRELAQIELAQKAKALESPSGTTNSSASVPSLVWRNVPCNSEEQAKQTIEEINRLVPDLTKKNLKKVLSEQYVSAYNHCQPARIPTKEEAVEQAALAKKMRRESLRNASSLPSEADSSSAPSKAVALSRPSPKPKVGNLAHVKGIPRPLGAYTDFLYHVRLHFHRTLALLDPAKLGSRINRGSVVPRHKAEHASRLDEIVSFEEDDHADEAQPVSANPSTDQRRQRQAGRTGSERRRSWIPKPHLDNVSAARI